MLKDAGPAMLPTMFMSKDLYSSGGNHLAGAYLFSVVILQQPKQKGRGLCPRHPLDPSRQAVLGHVFPYYLACSTLVAIPFSSWACGVPVGSVLSVCFSLPSRMPFAHGYEWVWRPALLLDGYLGGIKCKCPCHKESENRRDGSTVNYTGCSNRGFGFESQNPYDDS